MSISSNRKKEKENSEEKELKIGNYLIKKTLGEGTFGKVKLGIYIPTREKVGIKILEKKKIKEKDDEIRVKREFEMLIKFNHINVILVTEIFESYDSYFTVMEYCEGGELFNYIVKKRRLSEEESSFFYYQIINGLEYIHSLNICHRDLKPENLLLTKDHILKIIDFGLSNYFYDKNDLLSTPCGSPCYASPEMVSGKKYNGFKVDIWSTGIILYAMLCGFLPFEDKNNEILFKKIRSCKLEFPHYISLISKDLIKKILVTNPDKRIGIKEIKRHPFFLKGKTIFHQTFSFKKLPKHLGGEKEYNYLPNNSDDEDKESNTKNKEISKTNPNEKEKNKNRNKLTEEEEKNNFKTTEDKINNENIKITYEEDILDLDIKNNNTDKSNDKKKINDKNDYNNENNTINDINGFSDQISKTEPNTFNNKRGTSNKQKTLSPNQQFSTISHLTNHFNKISNYTNNINSMRMPFNKYLPKKHNNVVIKIKLSNNNNNKNDDSNYQYVLNKNSISKNSNANHLILDIIKMFNKSERKRPEIKIYDSLSNNYTENTVKTHENYINSNRSNSIYKKDSLSRNNKRKHSKINSMRLKDVYTNNLRTNRRKIISINTINNSTINSNNSRHSKLSSYQTTSTSIGKNKYYHSKSKTKQSLDNKIRLISFGDFLKKMK